MGIVRRQKGMRNMGKYDGMTKKQILAKIDEDIKRFFGQQDKRVVKLMYEELVANGTIDEKAIRKEENMRKFRISQTFETLGDPCAETFDTREAAALAASKMRGEIAEMVAGWATPDADDERRPTGYSNEIAAWAHAVSLSDGAPTYGREAGEYIAEQAVEIEEIADDAE